MMPAPSRCAGTSSGLGLFPVDQFAGEPFPSRPFQQSTFAPGDFVPSTSDYDQNSPPQNNLASQTGASKRTWLAQVESLLLMVGAGQSRMG